MNLSRTNIVLAAALVAVMLLAAAVNVDHAQPNLEFLPEMKRSPAYSAYAANDVFANGRTLQLPVSGTIARGELPLPYEATKEDAVRAGEELQNPYTSFPSAPATPAVTDERAPEDQASSEPSTSSLPGAEPADRLNASVQRGGDVYRTFCVCCHGANGAGDGPVAKRGFPPPPPLTTGKSAQMKDGQLFHILTYGQGSMAPMAAQLTQDRRWDVINYVRNLQESAVESAGNAQSTTPIPEGISDGREEVAPATAPAESEEKQP
jgi:mono/diheme cytochrome c family protein